MDDQGLPVWVFITELLSLYDLILNFFLVLFAGSIEEEALRHSSNWTDSWNVSDLSFGNNTWELAETMNHGVQEGRMVANYRTAPSTIIVCNPILAEILTVINFWSLVKYPDTANSSPDDEPGREME